MSYEGSSGARFISCRASRGKNVVFSFEPLPLPIKKSSDSEVEQKEEEKYFMIVEAILTSQNYPTRKISKTVYQLIDDEVEKLRKASQQVLLLVKVHSLDHFCSNSVKVDCIGLDVANFFDPLNGIKLKHIKLRVIPKKLSTDRLRVTIELKFVPGLSVMAVLDRLQLCYPNLNTNEWYVIRSFMDEDILKITVLMDKPSADFIRTFQYVLDWVYPDHEHWYSEPSESD